MKFEFCRRKAVYQFSKLTVFEINKFKSNDVYGKHIEKVKKKAGKAYFTFISKCKELNGLQP